MRKLIFVVVRVVVAVVVLLLAYQTVSSSFEQVVLSLLGLTYLAVLDNGVLAAGVNPSDKQRRTSIAIA